MVEVQSQIQTVEETREDFDNFGYNLMDCSSCLLVKMGEKANYSGMLYVANLRPDLPSTNLVQAFPANIVETYREALTINNNNIALISGVDKPTKTKILDPKYDYVLL